MGYEKIIGVLQSMFLPFVFIWVLVSMMAKGEEFTSGQSCENVHRALATYQVAGAYLGTTALLFTLLPSFANFRLAPEQVDELIVKGRWGQLLRIHTGLGFIFLGLGYLTVVLSSWAILVVKIGLPCTYMPSLSGLVLLSGLGFIILVLGYVTVVLSLWAILVVKIGLPLTHMPSPSELLLASLFLFVIGFGAFLIFLAFIWVTIFDTSFLAETKKTETTT